MSDTILSGDLTVYYLDDNRRKQIKWTGGTGKTDTQKLIDVYSATEDLMTIPTQQDDGLIFSAETPVEYTIGKIDAGDNEPWFIDLATMEHMVGDFQNFTGCALKTSGWTRVQDSNTGIVVVAVSAVSNTITDTDVGNDISHGDGDAGTLLDVVDTGGATDYLWIRPDSSAAANNFDSTSGTLTCNGQTATQEAAAVTGEMVWGNVYTTGALQPDTHIYIFQDGSKITANDQTNQDWWPDGHIDRAIPIKDYTSATFPLIDQGYLTVKANQYGTKYTYSIIRMNTTSGGGVAAGLSSGDDITNTTGYKSITQTAGSGNWTVGDEISGDTSNARAIITQIDNPGSTQTLHYYLIGDPLIDFQTAAEGITNEDDTGTGTKDGNPPANQGPALTTWFDGNLQPTYAFANTQVDIDDDGTAEEYGITIDLQSASLAQMHEFNKYTHRRGSTTDQDGLDGEEWIGLDYAVNYASITGTVSEGATVTGVTSGATGVVVSNPGGSNNTALLRNSRGTFQDGEAIEIDGSNRFDAASLTVEVIVPVAESSFGTLAGTTFFASRGVVLSNYKGSEENSWSTLDATGTTRARPTTITMQILNLKTHDYASCMRLTGSGGSVNKTEYDAVGGEVIGSTSITVSTAIAADVPGKTAGGHVVMRDTDDNGQEYLMRYDSYSAASGVVQLANVAIASAAGSTNASTIVSTAVFVSTLVGDLVYNTDRTAVSYVASVISSTEVQINPPITGQVGGDTIDLNVVPASINSADDIYFPIIFKYMESDGSTSATMQYVADIYAQVRVRNTADAAVKIKGYTAEVTIGTGGGTSSATRIENTVYGG